MIDIGIIMIVAVPFVNWIMGMMFPPLNFSTASAMVNQQETTQISKQILSEIWRSAKEQHVFERAVIENLLQGLFVAAYTLPFWFRYASTPGKMLLRMEIQDVSSGVRMSRGQAIIRFLGYFISLLPFSLGFFWAAFNKKCRAWHDMLAHTAVVVKPRKIADT